MKPQTNPLDTPSDGFEITLPDGRITTVEALLAEARSRRAAALRTSLKTIAGIVGESARALLAPVFGTSRRHLHGA